MAAKKPTGWRAFDKLMKRLVATPKSKVEDRIAQKRESSDRPHKK